MLNLIQKTLIFTLVEPLSKNSISEDTGQSLIHAQNCKRIALA